MTYLNHLPASHVLLNPAHFISDSLVIPFSYKPDLSLKDVLNDLTLDRLYCV